MNISGKLLKEVSCFRKLHTYKNIRKGFSFLFLKTKYRQMSTSFFNVVPMGEQSMLFWYTFWCNFDRCKVNTISTCFFKDQKYLFLITFRFIKNDNIVSKYFFKIISLYSFYDHLHWVVSDLIYFYFKLQKFSTNIFWIFPGNCWRRCLVSESCILTKTSVRVFPF